MTEEERPRQPGSRVGLFTQRWWSELVTVRPYRAQHWAAAQVGVCVAVPLVVLAAAGRLDLAGYAVFASICSAYGGRLRRADRLRAQLVVGAALTVAVAGGAAVGNLAHAAVWTVVVSTVLSGVGVLLARELGYLPIPSLFLVLTFGTVAAIPHRWSDLPTAAGVAVATVLFVVGVSQAAFGLRRSLVPLTAPTPLAPRQAFATPAGRAELGYFLLSPALAGTLAQLLTFGHPYWAAVSATVPLAGSGLAAQLGRATLRFLGTVVGLGLAFLLITADPPAGVLLAVIAGLQVLTELFVTRNYGIAVVFITPMALGLGHLAHPEPAAELIVDRLIQTCLGVGVAVAVLLGFRVALALSRRRAHAAVPR